MTLPSFATATAAARRRGTAPSRASSGGCSLAAKFGWMLDAMDFMLYAMAHRPAARLLRLRRRDGRHARHGDAGHVGRRRADVRLRGRSLRAHARADGHDRALLAGVARRRHLADASSSCCSGARCSASAWAASGRLAPCSSARRGRPQHRNKAISIMQSGWAIGYILAAVLAALILGRPEFGDEGWRWLFVAGVLPALLRPSGSAATCTSLRPGRGAQAERWRRAENPFAVIFGPRLLSRTLRIILLGSPPCSSPTGASSSGCRRSSPVRSSRAAPASASARSGGSSRCRSAPISAT